jgi:hypothetical protein
MYPIPTIVRLAFLPIKARYFDFCFFTTEYVFEYLIRRLFTTPEYVGPVLG